jgi:phosphoglycolate phosphatase-like HAD superfamily hydrolase
MLVSDFDGTLLHLAVDWDALRRELGVERISDLWQGRQAEFERVASAERTAAEVSPLNDAAIAAVLREPAFSVLTDNSESAVMVLLRRHDGLRGRCRRVVGRETLGAPKRHPDAFERGLRLCADAHGVAATDVIYLGDAAYELELAERFGARAVNVASVDAGQR